MRRGPIVSCCLLVASVPAIPAASSDLSADEILSEMRRVYADAVTYSDSGVVSTELYGDGGLHRWTVSFETTFVRDRGFRFEFRSSTQPDGDREAGNADRSHYVVWASAEGVHTWWTLEPIVRSHDSIEAALAGPTGISVGSAVRIPGLLMPEMRWGSLLETLGNAELAGEEVVDGRPCYKVEGDLRASPGSRTLWIDGETWLVRRVAYRLDDGRVVASYHPVLDEEIPIDRFEFDPDAESVRAPN